MKRRARLIMTLGVAAATPLSTLVLAQVEKAATKAVEVKGETAKAVTVEKVEAGKAEAAAVRVVPVLPGRPAGAANLDPLIRQFLPQVRPLMLAELHVIRAACDPTKEQRVALAREGDRVAEEATRKYAESYLAMQQRGRNAADPVPDPGAVIVAGLTRFVQEHLTPDQAGRYRAEVEKRAAALKALVVHNLVAGLDEELVLSTDQRAKLEEFLSSRWNPAWGSSLQVFLYGANYFPELPSDPIASMLGEAQKKVWAARPRGQGMFWGNINGMMRGVAIHEDDEAAHPADARPAEPAARKK